MQRQQNPAIAFAFNEIGAHATMTGLVQPDWTMLEMALCNHCNLQLVWRKAYL